MKISFDIEITPEEILSLMKLMDDRTEKESANPIMPISPCADLNPSWSGKCVRIKKVTPDSEIESWNKKLERDVIYGVTEQLGFRDIKIQRMWYPRIWFELVG